MSTRTAIVRKATLSPRTRRISCVSPTRAPLSRAHSTCSTGSPTLARVRLRWQPGRGQRRRISPPPDRTTAAPARRVRTLFLRVGRSLGPRSRQRPCFALRHTARVPRARAITRAAVEWLPKNRCAARGRTGRTKRGGGEIEKINGKKSNNTARAGKGLDPNRETTHS